MKFDLEMAYSLSTIYNVPIEDVILVALNRYGLRANMEDNRLRFKLKLNSYDETFYFAVCLNTYPSPFFLEGNELRLNDIKVGSIYEIEKDTCDSTYFRRNQTELTLNSNSRSTCKGCKFCGTYRQDPEDLYALTTSDKLSQYMEGLMETHHLKDLSHIVRVTICTGCFGTEENLVNHLIMIREVLRSYGFNKKIRYIGSELNTDQGLINISKYVAPFSLSLTLECFDRREQLIKETKQRINLEKVREIMIKSKELGFATNFLYIVGLDPLDKIEFYFRQLAPYLTRFPVVQIYQNYIPEHENLRDSEAIKIDYYFKARKIIENILHPFHLKPRTWENYRSLWYLTYADCDLRCIRI